MMDRPAPPAVLDTAGRLAIEALIHEHAWLIDHGQAQNLPALFTEDAALLGVGPDKRGRPAITAWADQRAAMTGRRSRHVQTNIRLLPTADGVVHGTVVLLVFRHDGPGPGATTPVVVGEYSDIYARDADQSWRFAERRLTVLFGEA